MREYKPRGGETIRDAAIAMVRLANFSGEVVTCEFNDIPLDAAPGSKAEDIVKSYWDECKRRHDAYLASPQYAKDKRDAEERQAKREADLAEALKEAPAKLTLRDAPAWEKSVAVNTDGYGGAVMQYADQWARVMEGMMATGETLEACAKNASRIADNVGLTGFQYGCAVGILSQVWTHGERLRRWHNLETQIRNEGERANETGSVLNPALLNIG